MDPEPVVTRQSALAIDALDAASRPPDVDLRPAVPPMCDDKWSPHVPALADLSETRREHDLRREAEGLLKRFQDEHDLLLKRTSIILTLNGLIATAVAFSDKLPKAEPTVAASPLPWLDSLATISVFVTFFLVWFGMITINVVWLKRASSARKVIDSLKDEVDKPEYAAVLPVHVQVHKMAKWRQHSKAEKEQDSVWLDSARFFSMFIPTGLLLYWLVGFPMHGLTWLRPHLQRSAPSTFASEAEPSPVPPRVASEPHPRALPPQTSDVPSAKVK